MSIHALPVCNFFQSDQRLSGTKTHTHSFTSIPIRMLVALLKKVRFSKRMLNKCANHAEICELKLIFREHTKCAQMLRFLQSSAQRTHCDFSIVQFSESWVYLFFYGKIHNFHTVTTMRLHIVPSNSCIEALIWSCLKCVMLDLKKRSRPSSLYQTEAADCCCCSRMCFPRMNIKIIRIGQLTMKMTSIVLCVWEWNMKRMWRNSHTKCVCFHSKCAKSKCSKSTCDHRRNASARERLPCVSHFLLWSFSRMKVSLCETKCLGFNWNEWSFERNAHRFN